MEFGLTIPLIRHLQKKQVPYGDAANPFYCWDLHVISLRGQKSLLVVHCTSRFTFVLWGLTAADWADLETITQEGIRRSLQEAGLAPAAVQRYLNAAGPAKLTKTHGRREVAFLNRAWDDVVALELLIDPEQQWQLALNDAVNDLIRRCAGHDGLGSAVERLHKDFQEREQTPS